MMVDELSTMADAVMGSLRGQRGTLKSAHRKVLDIASMLGVSNNLMRVIERRTLGDRILVYGGGAVLIALILLLGWYVR